MKVCRYCGRELKGRSDKKFCDDSCRNTFNNAGRSAEWRGIRVINSILRRNRQILEIMSASSTRIATREQMYQQGFDFRFHTHIFTNKKGSTYHFCYDYGYLPLHNGGILVVRSIAQETAPVAARKFLNFAYDQEQAGTGG